MAPAWAQQDKPAQEVYTCIDKSGRRITADRPIADCIDREQRILDHTGAERRRIGPTLTEHDRIAEERRRERVLLARYPDEATHREERLNALAQVDEVVAVAHKRIADLRGERKRIDVELEFYRRDPAKAPAKLQRQIAENDEAVAEQQRFIAAQDQEKRRVAQRFDAELAQLRQLWAAQRASAEQWTPPPGTR
jgi:vacuolar-type H+-ATPase subunit I/STV1